MGRSIRRLTDDYLLLFDVHGPRQIPTVQGHRGSRYIGPDQGPEFFVENDDLAQERGCYVFGMRSGGGITPWYVGKTTKSYESECFQPHKLVKYSEALHSGVGSPVLFFLVHPRGRGPPSKWAIEELETFLIQTAFTRNPKLLNKTKRGIVYWGIQGLLRGRQGKPSDAARSFGEALWLL
jgi:hypothetical protein